MKTLYEFIKSECYDGSAAALPAPEATRESIGNALVSLVPSFGIVPEKDVAAFSDGIAKLVTDDKFLKELSETVHQPSKGETEDEFVKRCNRALFALIDERLATKDETPVLADK